MFMAMHPDPDTSAGNAAANATPGELLAAAREAAGLTVDELAVALNLLPGQVRALEGGDMRALGGDVFARGHLRNAARCLGVDPQPLLESYDRARGCPRAAASVAGAGRLPPSLDQSVGNWPWGVAAALLVVGVLWWWQREPAQAPVAVAAPEAQVSGAGVAGPALRQVPPLAVSVAARTVAGEPLPELYDRLELAFSAECWVEVLDAEGELLLADLRRAGDRIALEGRAPFELVLGYAPGVSVTLNGEPVTVSTRGDQRRARLTVGDARARL